MEDSVLPPELLAYTAIDPKLWEKAPTVKPYTPPAYNGGGAIVRTYSNYPATTTSTPATKHVSKPKTTNVVDHSIRSAQSSWTEDETIDATIVMPAGVYTSLVNWFDANGRNEIAGWFSLKPGTRQISRLYLTDKGAGAHVNFSPSGLETVFTAFMESGDVIAGNWHTHPGLGTFWSSEDKDMMLAYVADDLMYGPTADATFMVFDFPYMMTTRVVVTDGDIKNARYNQGGVKLLGAEKLMPITETRTYSNYYSGYDSAYTQNWVWQRWTSQTDKGSKAESGLKDSTATLLETALESKDLVRLLQALYAVRIDDLSSLLAKEGIIEKFSSLLEIDL